MLNFKKIEINDIDIYKDYTLPNNELSCENSFVNLLVWQSAYNNMIAIKEGQLIIKSGFENDETFSLPFGDDFEKGIAFINEYCGEKKPNFWAQEGSHLELFRKMQGQNYIFNENRDAFDYIYLQTDMANLPGKKYHSKRNHINAFSKKFNWRYEKINGENVKAVKECADEWYAENAHRADSLMLCEKKGVDIILNNFEKLGILGGAIFVGKKVVAFTLGSAINSDIFDIHVEKALDGYSESYTVINNQFAKNELSAYKYINREDDLGSEGLRKAKLSYKPHILLKKYYCSTENCNG